MDALLNHLAVYAEGYAVILTWITVPVGLMVCVMLIESKFELFSRGMVRVEDLEPVTTIEEEQAPIIKLEQANEALPKKPEVEKTEVEKALEAAVAGLEAEGEMSVRGNFNG